MKVKLILMFVVVALKALLLDNIECYAQPQRDVSIPTVGKACPQFTLRALKYYSTDEFSNKGFKGKWLVLDFWFLGCVNCIKGFPKLNELQEHFQGNVQFLAIGKKDNTLNKNIELVYEKLRKKFNLNLAVAFDSVLVEKWGIHSMPHIIIIDPQGTVKFITDGRDMTTEKLQDLIDGKAVSFYRKDIDRPDFDVSMNDTKTYLDSLSYQSVFREWNGESQFAYFDIKSYLKDNLHSGFRASMLPLYAFYLYAYTGQWKFLRADSLYSKIYPKPLLQMADTSLFVFDYTYNLGKGTYNYSLSTSKMNGNVSDIMKIMQQDLKEKFGYNVWFEEREMPVWKLVAKEGAWSKLKSKGGESKFSGMKSSMTLGFTLKNYPTEELLALVMAYIHSDDVPCFDVTGFKGNIDITVDALMTDITEIRKSLNKYNLDLVKSTRLMTVLVIGDRK